jgi:uncharacterized membrane protein
MKGHNNSHRVCSICGKTFPAREVVTGEAIRPQIADQISLAHPEWSAASFICRSDLATFRMAYVQSLLESEKGEVTSLDQEVIQSLRDHELITSNIDAEFDQDWSLGERLADKIAEFGGSWTFLISFGVFLFLWIALNTFVLVTRPVDPFPFILLNLLLSCLAAMQAPIIMMSQNRQESKDRLRSQHDYMVNLKAELEIRHLHEKLDHLISHQWERLVEIQELQLDLLTDLRNRK